jgi:hypothetical protein
MTAFKGVRSSCDMFARNSLLCRLAASQLERARLLPLDQVLGPQQRIAADGITVGPDADLALRHQLARVLLRGEMPLGREPERRALEEGARNRGTGGVA